METVPTLSPDTNPAFDTNTFDESLDVQRISRPTSVPPMLSRAEADNCSVCPTLIMVEGALTTTLATGTGTTVMVTVPLWPSLVALIVVEPDATPTSSPASEMVPTEAFEDRQVTTRPVNVAPLAAIVAATSCRVSPTRSVASPPLIVTAATDTGAVVRPSPAVHPDATAKSPINHRARSSGVFHDARTIRLTSRLPR